MTFVTFDLNDHVLLLKTFLTKSSKRNVFYTLKILYILYL